MKNTNIANCRIWDHHKVWFYSLLYCLSKKNINTPDLHVPLFEVFFSFAFSLPQISMIYRIIHRVPDTFQDRRSIRNANGSIPTFLPTHKFSINLSDHVADLDLRPLTYLEHKYCLVILGDIKCYFAFFDYRCSISKEFPVHCQDNSEASVQSICSHLPPALSPYCRTWWGSASQHILQTLYVLCSRVQSGWQERTCSTSGTYWKTYKQG